MTQKINITLRHTVKRIMCAALLLAVFVLPSCNLAGDGGDLFKLPGLPGTISQLQSEIDAVMSGEGGEYAAPTGGINRQAVQLEDLDGDGREEAIVFLRMPSSLMRICLFSQDDEGKYRFAADATGEGTTFDTAVYYDLNSDGTRELLTGRSLGQGLPKELRVLQLDRDEGFRQLLSVTYTGFTQLDIDANGAVELVIVRHDLDKLSGVAEVYRYSETERALLLDEFTGLSAGVTALRRLRTGNLLGGEPAVFVSGEQETGGISTDICAFRDGEFVNIALDPETGISKEVYSGYTIWGSDLNSDGVFDLPMPVVLPSYETRISSETYRKIIWRNYDADGNVHEALQTLHSQSDGWYLIIPDAWHDYITVDRRDNISGTSGERSVMFSLLLEDEVVDVLSVYTLSGDNRVDRSELPGRFVITTPQTRVVTGTIYAAMLYELPSVLNRFGLTEQEVTEAFKLIQTEWLTGELTR